MPGPYHLALCRPVLRNCVENDEEYTYQEMLVAISENYRDSDQQPLWRFWQMTDGWFLLLCKKLAFEFRI